MILLFLPSPLPRFQPPPAPGILSSSHWPGYEGLCLCVHVCLSVGRGQRDQAGSVSIRPLSCPQPYQALNEGKRVEIRAGERGCVGRIVQKSQFCPSPNNHRSSLSLLWWAVHLIAKAIRSPTLLFCPLPPLCQQVLPTPPREPLLSPIFVHSFPSFLD